MNTQILKDTARALIAPGKGLLAADESLPTIGKRFEALGIVSTPENRRAYREMLLGTPDCEAVLSGVILFDETLRDATADGTPFPQLLAAKGILPGIKVDAGAHDFALHAGEKVTDGLDGLRERLVQYRELGARFAKWRAVIAIGAAIPTRACLEANAHGLARYAALCQEADIVPIVEPEVLLDGDHTIERCQQVTEATLRTTFTVLVSQGVLLEGMLLKPNMVLAGHDGPNASVEEVAQRTIETLRRTVPAALPGIVFLSGGQSDTDATARLNAMNATGESLPWRLTFSFARALQNEAMEVWGGNANQIENARAAFAHRLRLNSAAQKGQYNVSMEKRVDGEARGLTSSKPFG